MSRFTPGEVSVHGPDRGDRFTPLERMKREVAELSASNAGTLHPPAGTPLEARRAYHQKWLAANDLQPQEEVRTDAVVVVRQFSADESWLARWTLAEQDGTLAVRALQIEPNTQATPAGGITSSMLRDLRPSIPLAEAGNFLLGEANDGRDLEDDELWRIFIRFAREDVAEANVPVPDVPKQGRPPLSDDHVAAVAMAYLEELKRGRGVLKRLGVRFEREPETMRDQVRIARKRGFLSPAPKAGRKGATPGPELLRYLEREEGSS